MWFIRAAVPLAATALLACAGGGDGHTLAELRRAKPDLAEVRVENSLDQAMGGYQHFLEEAPESALTPEAMRRLADLKLEKEYGILGDGRLPVPEPAAARVTVPSESGAEFERRAAGPEVPAAPAASLDLQLPGGKQAAPAGPLEAIELYDRILITYPGYEHSDQVLYQKARAYDELGRIDEAIEVAERLIAEYPGSRHIDEVQFRRAEYFFTRRRYREAETAYSAIIAAGAGSEYYELALYKLGWTYYKQDLHEEALDQYVALLDYKISTGYDFEQTEDEETERRIADTYRVISLSFSNIGGPKIVGDYFAAKGHRSYEDRIYSQLGEFYLEKLRYDDAAKAYKAFVELQPLHRASPRFSMRVVEIYEAGGFPKLVLEAKKEFAASYGLKSEYWKHFDPSQSPEVLSYLKANLGDLANHYHALYQGTEPADEQTAAFQEATRWYRAYLDSFPADTGTPAVNRRLADLLLEHREFGEAAREYERTAYTYPAHDAAAAAGYAAIYAHREQQNRTSGGEREAARRDAVASTLRFVEAFPQHEHAGAVLAAAVRDLHAMREFEQAIARGRQLIDTYPQADLSIRRTAWTAIAHSAFELADYVQAEGAYAQVIEVTPADDASRGAIVENLAAAIYKQGESASLAGDHRSAADHFLRIGRAAPGSDIQAAAEYDAAAALVQLEDWAGAAAVLESFREKHPQHALHPEATKQIGFIYRKLGETSRAASEYERVAAEATKPELRAEALLVAGKLYEDAGARERAAGVYLSYVSEFPEPLETALDTRFTLAQIFGATGDPARRREQLQKIVEIGAVAPDARTPRTRFLAASAALALAEELHRQCREVELVQPLEQNLQEKQERLNAALGALGKLVDYEVAEITAAATYYMADLYRDFARALLASERPVDLEPGERESYETALAAETQPLEQKAVELHQKNLEFLAGGIYNAWIEKSLAELARLVPARYARTEASSGLIVSTDTYIYRPPLEPPPPASAADDPAPESDDETR